MSQDADFNVLPGLNGIAAKIPGDACNPKVKRFKHAKGVLKFLQLFWLHQRPHT